MVFVMVLSALFFWVLGSFCMRVTVGSGTYRALSRCLCAVCVLLALSLVPGVRMGVNLLNVAAIALLGVPGGILMQVIALMP